MIPEKLIRAFRCSSLRISVRVTLSRLFRILGPWLASWWSRMRSRAGIHEPPGPRTDRSDLVLDFLNFFGPGPVRSEIFQILLVLVRFGPRFSKFCWSWSGSVRDFPNLFFLVQPGPKFFENLLVLVRFGPRFSGYLKNRIRFGSKIAPFPEAAFDANAELDQTSVIYWNRIRSKCWFGSQFRYLLKPHRFQMWKRSKFGYFLKPQNPFQIRNWVRIRLFLKPHPLRMRNWVKIGLFS